MGFKAELDLNRPSTANNPEQVDDAGYVGDDPKAPPVVPIDTGDGRQVRNPFPSPADVANLAGLFGQIPSTGGEKDPLLLLMAIPLKHFIDAPPEDVEHFRGQTEALLQGALDTIYGKGEYKVTVTGPDKEKLRPLLEIVERNTTLAGAVPELFDYLLREGIVVKVGDPQPTEVIESATTAESAESVESAESDPVATAKKKAMETAECQEWLKANEKLKAKAPEEYKQVLQAAGPYKQTQEYREYQAVEDALKISNPVDSKRYESAIDGLRLKNPRVFHEYREMKAGLDYLTSEEELSLYMEYFSKNGAGLEFAKFIAAKSDLEGSAPEKIKALELARNKLVLTSEYKEYAPKRDALCEKAPSEFKDYDHWRIEATNTEEWREYLKIKNEQ